jgi:hypothetical protein
LAVRAANRFQSIEDFQAALNQIRPVDQAPSLHPPHQPPHPPPPPPPPPTASPIHIFVGSNYSYYAVKWNRIDATGSRSSWNWSAFFAGPIWLAYRKMYGFAYGWVIVNTIVSMLALVEIDQNSTGWFYLILPISYVIVALQANALYKDHAAKRVAKILAISTPQTAYYELQRRGGASAGAVFGMLATLFALSLVLLTFMGLLMDKK